MSKYKNTIVIEFDSLDDPKRKEVSDLMLEGLSEGWVTYMSISDDVDRGEYE